jgi:hypothetical protein
MADVVRWNVRRRRHQKSRSVDWGGLGFDGKTSAADERWSLNSSADQARPRETNSTHSSTRHFFSFRLKQFHGPRALLRRQPGCVHQAIPVGSQVIEALDAIESCGAGLPDVHQVLFSLTAISVISG